MTTVNSMVSITNYRATGDWFYILPAVALLELIVIFLCKYPTNPNSKFVYTINKWYDTFGPVAVLADIMSMSIGIAVPRYIFTALGFKSVLVFIALVVAFQLTHDILFYTAVLIPMPPGHNKIIDLLRTYGSENGYKVLLGDALMMLGCVAFAYGLKSLPAHVTILVGLITVYALCYVIYTRDPTTLSKIAPKPAL